MNNSKARYGSDYAGPLYGKIAYDNLRIRMYYVAIVS